MPHRNDVVNLIPGAKVFPDGQRIVVPHSRQEVRLLRHLGIPVPAPILHQYKWPGPTPFKSQQSTAALLTTSSRAYVLNEMGTGKTRAALFAIDFLIRTGESNKVLIAAPMSTMNPVWHSEIFQMFTNLRSVVLHGTRAKRLKLLADPTYDVYIINHDGIHIILDDIKKRPDIDTIIIDELTAFRNKGTDRWKTMSKIVRGRKFVWGMTGAPTPNEPVDAYAQVKLLTPNNVPMFASQFRDKTMYQVTQFKWRPRPDANDIVHQAMQPSVRFKRDEVVELPPTIYSERDPELSSPQKKFYKVMKQHLQVQYAAHEITAVNEGVKLGKLLQICMGYIYTDDKRTLSLAPMPRLKLLKEIYEEAAAKLIIFVPLISALKQVHAFMAQFCHAELVYGDTPTKKRDQIFYAFEKTDTIDVIIAHPKTMSHGLTLTAADTIVWYSPITSYETYEQANARIPRPGQTKTTHIINIVSSPVERQVFNRLKHRQGMQGALLDLFEGVDEGV